VVVETNNSGAVTVSYVLGNGQLISQKRGATTSYYLPDAQGSTRALTTPAAAITDTYRYSAFGDIETQTGTTTNNYLYTGQQFDASTGLYSLRARYYDPNVGRFLSRDTYPINHQNPVELNRYVYAAGNPVRYSDPSGLESEGYAATYFPSLQVKDSTFLFATGVVVGVGVMVYVLCILSGDCALPFNRTVEAPTRTPPDELSDEDRQWLQDNPPPSGPDWNELILRILRLIRDLELLRYWLEPNPNPNPDPDDDEESRRTVLVLGESPGFAYAQTLASAHSDWNVVGSNGQSN
jgi:RHS repeat-associated protein